MIEFGKSLITAREAKGLTIEQIAEQTHMASKTIRQLEAEDFSSFPAPIYGRGFVKLYCGAVGLEPKPFVDEFMEIYNGNRDLNIREREVPAEEPKPVEPPPKAVPADLPFDEPPAARPAERPAAAEPPPAKPVGRTMPPLPEVPPPPQMTLPLGDTPEPGSLSRYAAPLHEEHARPSLGFTFSPAIWRLALLALVAAGVVWGLVIGLKALHKATAGEGEGENREEVEKVEKAEEKVKVKVKGEGEGKAAEKAKAKGEGEQSKAKSVDAASRRVDEKATKKPREPQKIPPLYID